LLSRYATAVSTHTAWFRVIHKLYSQIVRFAGSVTTGHEKIKNLTLLRDRVQHGNDRGGGLAAVRVSAASASFVVPSRVFSVAQQP
jgi:hypothetical protein